MYFTFQIICAATIHEIKFKSNWLMHNDLVMVLFDQFPAILVTNESNWFYEKAVKVNSTKLAQQCTDCTFNPTLWEKKFFDGWGTFFLAFKWDVIRYRYIYNYNRFVVVIRVQKMIEFTQSYFEHSDG